MNPLKNLIGAISNNSNNPMMMIMQLMNSSNKEQVAMQMLQNINPEAYNMIQSGASQQDVMNKFGITNEQIQQAKQMASNYGIK